MTADRMAVQASPGAKDPCGEGEEARRPPRTAQDCLGGNVDGSENDEKQGQPADPGGRARVQSNGRNLNVRG